MVLNQRHKELNEKGQGSCSVPMWIGGLPAGFCDKPAFSGNVKNYSGYVAGLACTAHGGLKKEEALNLCDYCTDHPAECNGNPVFGCGRGNDNVYECNQFETKK